MRRVAAIDSTSPRPQSESRAESRLELLDALLRASELGEAAQRAVDWICDHHLARAAMCAVLSPDRTQLIGVAGARLSPTAVAGYSHEVDDSSHPLRRAMFATTPTVFRELDNGGNGHGLGPFGAAGFTAMPLVGSNGDDRAGLLFLATTAAPHRDIRWTVDVLGRRLVQLRAASMADESERRLARERVLLEAIINAVPDPILLTDLEGRLLIANSRAEALFTAGESESEGRRRAVALNNMLFSSALSRRAFEGAETARRELLLVDPIDGSDLLFELLSAVTNEPREGTGVVSILRNVTDLRRATEEIEDNLRRLRLAEADVRAERDRLDLIIDSVADPILVTDPAGAIILMNAPAERLFTAIDGASDEAQRTVRANDAHFSSFVSNLFFSGAGTRWRGEIGLVDPLTSASMPVEAIAGKILSEHGEVTAVVTILHDRTEAIEKARLYEQLKRASDQLEQKVREATAELVRQNELLRRQAIELEQASNLKSQFLANVSHEFRTPLNAILGYTAMLLQGVGGELQSSQRRHVQRVESNGRHLLSIINDILDIARIEAGKMPLHYDEFSLPELLNEVLAEVEPIIQRTQLEVMNEVPAALPPMRSDRQKVKQIVLNLLTNALKFTPRGSVRMRTDYDAEADEAVISVTDTGIGIGVDDLDKIFEDFRQADNSPTREYGGTGLGLSICRRLCKMLGGTLTVRSKLGEGSTFTLTLPRRPRRTK